jgi:hypothetical protein
MIKRSFITFTDGELNDSLTDVLNRSISNFSSHSLKVYRKEDFDVSYDTSDPNFWSSGLGYVYKILSCLKALEEYDEVVWIDTDCVVTNYIDKIWFESWRIDSYPLLPKYRFHLFDGSKKEDPFWFLKKGKERIGSNKFENRQFYSQACFMFFDKSCKGFFEETLSNFEDYDKESFPNGDESIINCLFLKYGFNDSLGDIFLCSEFFGYSLIDFISIKERDQFMNFVHKPLYNTFENILFLHGNKSPIVASDLLDAIIYHRGDKNTSLCEIMKRNGSDKSTWHNYTKTYHELFSHMVGKNINIFEMGLGTSDVEMASNMGILGVPGASLRGWKEYFINANVYGADIDNRILFQTDGIKTFFCDQTDSESISQMWQQHDFINTQFDIIIDDGLHEYHANKTFFECSFHKLKPGGLFIIEDLLPVTVQMFKSVVDILEKTYGCKIEILEIPYEKNYGGDNSLLIARKRQLTRN